MTESNGQGIPPHDEFAERAFLGSVALDNDCIDESDLNADSFYIQRHKILFGLMQNLRNNGNPYDAVAVCDAANSQGQLEEIGGVDGIKEILDSVPSSFDAGYYAGIIQKKARLRKLHRQCTGISRACLSPGSTWEELNDGIGDLRDLLDDCDSTNLKAVPIGDLIKDHPKLKPVLIDGLIRLGETANIIANPKVGKSWLSYDLALSIATGMDWLMFKTTPGKVLIIDNELHPESIAGRIPTVADALSIRFYDYQDRVDVISLRGRLTDFYGIEPMIRRLKQGQYAAVIVDAYYRMLPKGTSENDNAQIAGVYNQIDNYAASTNAAWFLIHHSTKGSQSDKRATDVGAGAGSQSRAADCHLVLREHEDAGFVVLDAAVRSFPPVEPVVLEWCFPLWLPVQDMDPSKLKGKQTKSEQRQNENDREAILIIAGVLLKGPATASVIRTETGFGRDRAIRLLGKMKTDGQLETIETIETIAGGNKTMEYKLCD